MGSFRDKIRGAIGLKKVDQTPQDIADEQALKNEMKTAEGRARKSWAKAEAKKIAGSRYERGGTKGGALTGALEALTGRQIGGKSKAKKPDLVTALRGITGGGNKGGISDFSLDVGGGSRKKSGSGLSDYSNRISLNMGGASTGRKKKKVNLDPYNGFSTEV